MRKEDWRGLNNARASAFGAVGRPTDRPTMRRFLACQNSILEEGAREGRTGRKEGDRASEGEGEEYKWGKFRQKAKPYNLFSA